MRSFMRVQQGLSAHRRADGESRGWLLLVRKEVRLSGCLPGDRRIGSMRGASLEASAKLQHRIRRAESQQARTLDLGVNPGDCSSEQTRKKKARSLRA